MQVRTFPITQTETNYTTLKANQTWSASVGIECILMPNMSWHSHKTICIQFKHAWRDNQEHACTHIKTQHTSNGNMHELCVCATMISSKHVSTRIYLWCFFSWGLERAIDLSSIPKLPLQQAPHVVCPRNKPINNWESLQVQMINLRTYSLNH